jgi:UPF0755 protein
MMLRSAVFMAVSFVAIAVLYCYSQLMVPLAPVQDTLEVKIEKGESFASAVSKLSREGLVKDRRIFRAVGRLSGLDKKLVPGYYQFYGMLRPWDVYETLKDGHIVQWKVTVVEGDTLMDVKETVVGEGIMNATDFDRYSTDQAFLETLGINAPSLEGYLFPDTYAVSKGSTPPEVFGMMFRRLEEVYDDEMTRRAEFLGMTRREILTLASIIEKEAILDSERPIIAGVYHNRLNIGMPLQADPTAIYGIKPQSAGITRRDIRRKTKYNTYHIKGLPPGPIAAPGLKSIMAALYPKNVPYLYFVANYQGGHTFSITMDEHLGAIREYRERKYAARMEAARAASSEEQAVTQ